MCDEASNDGWSMKKQQSKSSGEVKKVDKKQQSKSSGEVQVKLPMMGDQWRSNKVIVTYSNTTLINTVKFIWKYYIVG